MNTAFVASNCPNAEPQNAIKVVVDWIKGDADKQRLLFIDLAKACSASCNFLADELEQTLKHADRDQPAMPPAVRPNAPMGGPEPNSIASFHKLALDLIDESVAVLHFRMGHGKDWSELRNEKLPAHLREPLSTALRLDGDLSLARHELKRAIEDDAWYGVRAVPMHEARLSGEAAREELRARFLDEMERDLVQLKERVAEANEAAQLTAEARNDAEIELATEWRKEHHARLASLLAEYEPQYNLHRLQISGLVDMQKYTLGELAEGTSSGCQVLLTFAQRVHNGRIDRFHGLDATHLKAVVETEIGWLARAVPSKTSIESPSVKAPANDRPSDDIQFGPIEKAIVLLIRDRGTPKSMREYAALVGINHSNLSRSSKWQAAWKAANANSVDLAEGYKDSDGNIEAWKTEHCENCRQELVTQTVDVKGERMRVCEDCAAKLA